MKFTLAQVASHSAAFLIGALVGAAGNYLAALFTDQRRRQEARAGERAAFERVRQLMPALIDEMTTEVRNRPTSREFFILKDRSHTINRNGYYCAYFQDEHADLMEEITILENEGYIIDDTVSNVPRYRMTEEFVALLSQ